MKSILNIVLAVVAGVVVGSLVNMGIVSVGPSIIPLPEGADVSTMESMKESMKLFTFVNFIPPFLAHAVGTLSGAFVAAKIAREHKMRVALCLGFFFLLGGISAVVMLGGPLWFKVTDLVLAYLPMAFFGGRLAGAK